MKRYEVVCDADVIVEHKKGSYIEFSDHEKEVEIQKKAIDAQREEIERMKKVLKNVFDLMPSEATVGHGIKWRKLAMTAKMIAHSELSRIMHEALSEKGE